MNRCIQTLLARPVALVIFFTALVISGIVAGAAMSVNLFPSIDIPEITVLTQFNGLPAVDIREIVTIPLEDALSGLGGLKRIQSYSRDGFSLIQITLAWGTRMDIAGMKIREILNATHQILPNDSDKPMILPVNPSEASLMILGIFPRKGVRSSLARDMVNREIRTAIQQMEGVGSLQIIGGRKEIIEIQADQFRLNSVDLSIDRISQAIKTDNIEYPAGSLTEGEFRYIISVDGRRENWKNLSEIYLPGSKEGKIIQVDDVAEVRRVLDERDSFLLDGKGEGSALFIRRAENYSSLSLSRNIRQTLEKLNRAYGKDLRFEILHDASKQISTTLLKFVQAVLLGILAVFFILFFYLKRIGFSLIILTAIPISFLGTLSVLQIMGISFNIMSIGGFAIGIGMIVYNSVVVLENLNRKAPSGNGMTISETVAETAPSIFRNVFIMLLVFLPLLFIQNLMGELFRCMAWTIMLSLIFSLISSLVWIPFLYQAFPGTSIPSVKQPFGWRFLFRRILRNPIPVFVGSLLFVLIGFLCITGFKFYWIVPIRGTRVELLVDYPYGTTVEFIRQKSRDVIENLEEKSGIESLFITGGGDFGDPYFLANPENRIERMNCVVFVDPSSDWNPWNLSEELYEILSGTIGINIRGFYPTGFVEKTLSGNQRRRLLIPSSSPEAAFNLSENLIETIPLLNEVRMIPREHRPEVRVIPDRKKLSLYGIGLDGIASIIGTSISGRTVSFVEESGRRIPIRVRLPENNRKSRESLEKIFLKSSLEKSIQLRTLVSLKNSRNHPVLYRENRRDAVLVLAETNADKLIQQGKGLIVDPTYKERLSWRRETFVLLMVSSGLLYIMLGIQFNSFVLPILFLLLQPIAIASSLILLWISRRALDLNSMIGLLVVLSQSINNAIVLYETCKHRIRKGFSPGIAVYAGTIERTKSIMISGIITVAVLLPLAMDFSGRNPQQTLFLVILGGSFTLIPSTLFLFPSIINFYESKNRKLFQL